LIGGTEILGHAEAVFSKDVEIVLAIGQNMRGGFAVSFYRERIVGLIALRTLTAKFCIALTALLRRRRVPRARLAHVLGDALAALITWQRGGTGQGKPRACGAFEPMHRLGQVLGGPFTLRIAGSRIGCGDRPKRRPRAWRGGRAPWAE
jgi:hypothetical protein